MSIYCKAFLNTLILCFFLPAWSADKPVAKTPVKKARDKEQEWKPGEPLNTVKPPDEPFWKAKEKNYKKIVDEKAILVSVKSTEIKERKQDKNHLLMIGAGHTNAPADFAYQVFKDLNNLKKISDHIVESKFDPKTHLFFLHTQAFNYHAKMVMRTEFREPKDPEQPPELAFEIISGVFEGMTAVIRVEDYKRRKAEISMTAEYHYDKLPIPGFFITFGLEVVLQRMAARVRSYTEQKYQSQGAAK